jgi:carbon storage regulator CsrA
MLVLSRKAGQKLVIDDNITIIIQRISGNRVSIGIEAPDDVHIMRGELEKIRRELVQSHDDSAKQPPAVVRFLDETDPPADLAARSLS